MGYISQTEFKLFIADQIADAMGQFGGASATSGSAKLDQIIDWESSEVDSFLEAHGLTVPLSNPPPNIKKIVAYRVAYTLYTSLGQTPPEGIQRQYDDGISWLAWFARNQVKVPGVSPSATDGPGGSVLVSGSNGGFGIDNLNGTWL